MIEYLHTTTAISFTADEYGPAGYISVHAAKRGPATRILWDATVYMRNDAGTLGDKIDELEPTRSESDVLAFVALHLPLPAFDDSNPADAAEIHDEVEADRAAFAREVVAGMRLASEAGTVDFWATVTA